MKSFEYEIKLRYFHLTIRVRSHEASDMTWIKEFFSPQFEVTSALIHDCEVDFLRDDAYFKNLSDKKPALKQEVNGFFLRKKMTKFLQWQSLEDKEIVFDPEFNVFYILSLTKKNVMIVAHTRKSIGSRTALMRVIREFSMNHARTCGGHFVHSSAFSLDGKGMIIAGPKNAGKTSLLIYLLQNLPSRFITNDRVLISLNQYKFRLLGMPSVITVSKDTFAMFPQLESAFAKHRFHHRYTIDEILEENILPYKKETQIFTFSPGQFCTLLKAIPSPGSPLSAVLFPKVSKTKEKMSLKILAPQEASEKLKTAELIKTALPSQSIFNINTHKSYSPKNKLDYEEFTARLASQIPCYDCILGPPTYESKESIDLIKQILESSESRLS